ncbi:uncharacterized protein LOC113279514 [Papaver somniferum]|uniref:uncharacterized protein LOC113279514 n=1 Tax=Papaver somniferum TaxID=3469 RepID=UPI000E6FC853|nr:uncharacterized protein LOC113279514 [Papaver somniferum]
MHASWISTLQEYTFSIQHKSGLNNKVADALSRFNNHSAREFLIVTIRAEVIAFDSLKELYPTDPEFSLLWQKCSSKQQGTGNFALHNGFLFKGSRLCIPDGSIREHLIKELHSSGLSGHFGRIRLYL